MTRRANDNHLRASPAPRVFVEFRPAMRGLIEDAIESLLLLLDEIDGDADLEEEPDIEEGGDDEPSLGAPRGFGELAGQMHWSQGGSPDGEDEDGGDDELTGDEDEPSLGSHHDIDQSHWGSGGTTDCEADQ